jgi:hypothetical protein
MNAFTTNAPRRRRRLIAGSGLAAIAAVVAALAAPSPASANLVCGFPDPINTLNCQIPMKGTFTFQVPLSAATATAAGLPGDPGASGTSVITMSADTFTVCAHTSWTNVHSPVVMAHIHGGAYGKPEDPAITIPLFGVYPNGAPNPANGCATVAPGEIGAIVDCPQQFNVVVHSQKHPWAAIRGQLGTKCELP